MEDNLYQIIYASIETRPMSEPELITLLKFAREKNTRLAVTGMLLHCDKSFIQALEGPKDTIMDLFRVIKEDPRHHRMVVLFEGPIRKRNFSQWSMGFKRPSADDISSIEGYTPFFELGDDPKAIQRYSGVALKLLEAFRDVSDQTSS